MAAKIDHDRLLPEKGLAAQLYELPKRELPRYYRKFWDPKDGLCFVTLHSPTDSVFQRAAKRASSRGDRA